MRVEEVKWLDKNSKEAILKIVSKNECLVCFSHPCRYTIGDVIAEPLECLDTNNIILCEIQENDIKKMEGEFKYRLKGVIKDKKNGIVVVNGFYLHIHEEKIPKDISNDVCIQFEVSRIDIW